LGGASLHNRVSGVAHYRAADDGDALRLIRTQFRAFPEPPARREAGNPARSAAELAGIVPEDHRMPYDIGAIAAAIFDEGDFLEFQPEYAAELLCVQARLAGHPVAVIANRRGFVKNARGPRIGGVIYAESARKASYFVEFANRHGVPLLYLQDTSGFMIGQEAESEGIIRAGAEMVESMACADVPKIVLTINHASGAGYYAMAGQGFDPYFTLGWPTARIGVMEGESAVQATHGRELQQRRAAGEPLPEGLENAVRKTKADYEQWLDATYAAAHGHIDAIVDPAETRDVLAFLLDVVTCNPRASHLPVDLLS
jgi:3-methylcrotonyl-CoA carboxylase beta subunit